MLEPLILFEQAGFTVTITSPKGGQIPFDPGSLNAQVVGPLAEKYQKFLAANPYRQFSMPLSEVIKAPQFPYDVVYLAGGHGTLADFYPNPELQQILQRALKTRKILAGVCHGVVGLLNLEAQGCLEGAELTGFSNAEEDAIQMTDIAKKYLNDTLQNRLSKMVGTDGQYRCAPLWQPCVVNYQNRLITGQAPSSAQNLAQEIIRVLNSLSGNKVKASIQKGYPVFGSFITIGHPAVAETLSLTGIDFVWIEGEHAALSLPQILSLNMAVNQSSVVSIVRVPTNDIDTIKQYVDTGAMGIIVPAIKTVEDAQLSVRALKYPPEGERSMGLGRATRYFIKLKEYLATANRDVMVILMIEHKDAVANLEEILKVAGIDLLCIGPFDLSASFGIPGQTQHPVVQQAIQKVEVIAQKAGIPLGISVPDQATAAKLMKRGYRFFVIGADVEYLYQVPRRFFETPPAKLGWQIDNTIKYSCTYLEDERIQECKITDWEYPKPAPFSPAFKADITNIQLSGILGLGFPLPTRADAEKYNCYLKLYHYPQCLNAKASADRVMNDYVLDKIPGADVLRKYIENPSNVYIKHAVIEESARAFGEADPFPSLKIPKSTAVYKGCSIPNQVLFDASIPFLSLYLEPTSAKPIGSSPAMQAQWSVQGMLAFYPQLLKTYRENLIEVTGPDSNSYYFIKPNYQVPQSAQMSQFTVLRVPKQPMVFSNFADLPMPQKPGKIFLTGLLLVYKTDYTSPEPWLKLVSQETWIHSAIPTSSQILEVGAVVEPE